MSCLVFAKGLNEACIDVVDGDAEDDNNHVLGHSFGERVSILYNHGHIGRQQAHLLKTVRSNRGEM